MQSLLCAMFPYIYKHLLWSLLQSTAGHIMMTESDWSNGNCTSVLESMLAVKMQKMCEHDIHSVAGAKTLVQKLTDSSRWGQLHLVGMENVIHAGSCSLLKGTMQDDQGLLWHTWVHESMYSAQPSKRFSRHIARHMPVCASMPDKS